MTQRSIPARYSRQRLLTWIGEGGQRAISSSSVAIVGLGGLGSTSADLLARAGVGRLHLLDRDIVEESNLHRQTLYTERDALERLPKAVAAERRLREVNSAIEIKASDTDVGTEEAREIFETADLVLDATDNFETRYLLNDASVATGTPWIYGGAISTYGAWMTMVPDEGPCLRCLYPMPPPPGSIPTCETAGVIGPTPSVIASYQTAEALKILAGRRDLLLTGYIQVDLMDGRLHRLAVPPSPTCPCCVTRRFDFLEGESASRTHRICGSGGILVLAPRGTRLDLKALEKRYRDVGPVFRNPYLIETEWEGHSVTLYPDGRALIKGTSDPARARALYARFLGV